MIPLFRDAFGRDFTVDQLERKFAYDHGGLTGFVCVAFAERVSPPARSASSRGAGSATQVETAGQMVDVSTGSAHRGNGLFVALAERAREVCEEAGVGFLYGFPERGGVPDLDPEARLRATVTTSSSSGWPVRTLPAEKVSHRLGPLRGLYEGTPVGRSTPARPSIPCSPTRSSGTASAVIDRDHDFHTYKRAFGGSRVVATAGGRAWIKIHHGILIGDLEATSDGDLEETVRSLERLAGAARDRADRLPGLEGHALRVVLRRPVGGRPRAAGDPPRSRLLGSRRRSCGTRSATSTTSSVVVAPRRHAAQIARKARRAAQTKTSRRPSTSTRSPTGVSVCRPRGKALCGEASSTATCSSSNSVGVNRDDPLDRDAPSVGTRAVLRRAIEVAVVHEGPTARTRPSDVGLDRVPAMRSPRSVQAQRVPSPELDVLALACRVQSSHQRPS